MLLGTAGLAGLSQGCNTSRAGAGLSTPRAGTALNEIILFQGDSITDAGRSRDKALFAEAVKWAPPQHWAGDGVHPTAFGAALMAHQWLNIVAPSKLA